MCSGGPLYQNEAGRRGENEYEADGRRSNNYASIAPRSHPSMANDNIDNEPVLYSQVQAAQDRDVADLYAKVTR